MQKVKFKSIFNFQKKSKIKAGDGFKLGEAQFPFYTSSNVLTKSIDEYLFEDESLIFGTGGLASIHFCNEKFAVSTDCFVTQPKDKKQVFSKFVYYYLSGNMNILESGFKGAGLKHISKDYLENIEIPLPPFATQQKIATILEQADTLIQNNRIIVQKYDALTRSLFLEMFGDPVRNNLNLPFPKIGELTNVSQGMQIAIKERYKENGPNRYKYLTVAYLNGRKEEEYIESPRSSVICKKDEVLMIRTGNTGQVVTNVEGVFHNNFFKIDWNKERLNKNYLVHFLSNPGIRRDLLKRASTTTIPDLSHGQFYDLNIIIPPIDLQNQFAESVALIEAQKQQAQLELAKSEALFASLLQQAFKGELI